MGRRTETVRKAKLLPSNVAVPSNVIGWFNFFFFQSADEVGVEMRSSIRWGTVQPPPIDLFAHCLTTLGSYCLITLRYY